MSVTLTPTSDVVAALASPPVDNTIYLANGTYPASKFPTAGWAPKASTKLLAVNPRGAILDGQNTAHIAVKSGNSGVTLSGLVIKNFLSNPNAPYGAVDCGPSWTVDDVEISFSGKRGISLGKSGQLICSRAGATSLITRNGEYGIVGQGANGFLIQDVEHSYNNASLASMWNSGGCKMFGPISGGTFRRIYSHDNWGHALHCDTDVLNVLYENNRIENNFGIGIFFEISQAATIRYNTLLDNGRAGPQTTGAGGVNGPYGGYVGLGMASGAQIFVSDSPNCQVYGNVVDATIAANGLGLWDSNRGTSTNYGDVRQIYNEDVHDNDVTLPGTALAGLLASTYPTPRAGGTWLSQVRFTHNTYHTDTPTTAHWNWA